MPPSTSIRARPPRLVTPPARTRPGVRPAHVEETAQEPARLWQLVLLDDDDHSYEYVIEMLAAIFGYGTEKAFALARIVDTQGRVVLMTGERADCEAKQVRVHAYGADPRIPRCRGSMTAVVEEAGGGA